MCLVATISKAEEMELNVEAKIRKAFIAPLTPPFPSHHPQHYHHHYLLLFFLFILLITVIIYMYSRGGEWRSKGLRNKKTHTCQEENRSPVKHTSPPLHILFLEPFHTHRHIHLHNNNKGWRYARVSFPVISFTQRHKPSNHQAITP